MDRTIQLLIAVALVLLIAYLLLEILGLGGLRRRLELDVPRPPGGVPGQGWLQEERWGAFDYPTTAAPARTDPLRWG